MPRVETLRYKMHYAYGITPANPTPSALLKVPDGMTHIVSRDFNPRKEGRNHIVTTGYNRLYF